MQDDTQRYFSEGRSSIATAHGVIKAGWRQIHSSPLQVWRRDTGDRVEVAIGKHRSMLWDWAVLEGPDQKLANQGMANRMTIAMLFAQMDGHDEK